MADSQKTDSTQTDTTSAQQTDTNQTDTTSSQQTDTNQTGQQKTSIVLSTSERNEVTKIFSEARDFRSIGEAITAPIDRIIAQTAVVIDKDPIMNVSTQLEKMNQDVQGVYKDIIETDGPFMKLMKSVPLLGRALEKVDEAKFNMKTVEGKINVIFDGFDQSYESINTSVDLQKDFLEVIEDNLGKTEAYKNFLAEKIEDFQATIAETEDEEERNKYIMFLQNVEFFQTNLIVLIGNLDVAKKRLEMRLDSATKLSLAMNSSRPIFKTLLSTALIETSSQQAIDASIKTMQVMGSTIDKMSKDLTDKAIAGTKKAQEIASKPVLSTSQFVENVSRLKQHFDQIDDFRQQIALEAAQEKKVFEDAKDNLGTIKLLSQQTTEEFHQEIQA